MRRMLCWNVCLVSMNAQNLPCLAPSDVATDATPTWLGATESAHSGCDVRFSEKRAHLLQLRRRGCRTAIGSSRTSCRQTRSVPEWSLIQRQTRRGCTLRQNRYRMPTRATLTPFHRCSSSILHHQRVVFNLHESRWPAFPINMPSLYHLPI